ncbi:hypothetical protein CVU82_00100 [Candidatus Falkowbacteria bacterium HGW-Falkowbacteria-1]|uniref:Uncharacterized protein n=1 Tax=Candidatus Falkowbacteria bacterium HGW-Falkowbacteria-1 TaxID=2013768 RepID=A0A2N2EA39_9BACT|nr:MAG: hypothetical protein CVU82_00100 [Candidatus Falkowbacteria bacterium HGW-Falkowbacteria-1]
MKMKKITTKKILKNTLIVLSSSVLLFLLTLFFSYLRPNEILIIENLRLPIQEEILTSIGNYTIDNEYLNDYINEEYRIDDGKNNVSLQDLRSYLEELKPGDIFFTNSGKYLSSLFIPGKWKHAAIYLGSKKQTRDFLGEDSDLYKHLLTHYVNGDEILIIDSSSHGVKIREFDELSNLSSSSYLKSITAFRIKTSDKELSEFLTEARKQEGKAYDYDMITESNDYVYCSELIYHSLKKINLVINNRSLFLAREIITPNDALYYIAKNEKTSNNFSFIFFIEKENGRIKNFSKNDLIIEINP